MTWLESWLATQVHESAGADPTERARHERFIVARSAAAAITLACLPPVLLWRGVPSNLESLALLALVVPLAAVALLSRCGGLGQAQAFASAALVPLVASLCAALGGPFGPAALLLLVIPFEAMTAGSKGGFLASVAMAALSLPLALALVQGGPAPARAELMGVAGAVALILAFSHALAALAVDLRLRALVRAALQAGEAREGATLQVLEDLITWHDRNGLVLRANAAASRLLGVPPLALQGRGLFARVHVADRPTFLKAISDAAASGESVTARLRMTAREGSPLLWVEMRAHRLSGGSASVVAVSRDITRDMDDREAGETARTKVEAAGRAQAALLSRAGRDLREPLSALIDVPCRLSENRFGGSTCAENIREAGRRLRGTAETLQEFSVLAHADHAPAPEGLDVAALARAVCEDAEAAAVRTGIAIACEVAPGLPDLNADRTILAALLKHLVMDAAQAAPQGSRVCLRVRQERQALTMTVSGPAGSAPDPEGLGASLVQALGALLGGTLVRAQALGIASTTVTCPLDRGTRPTSGAGASNRVHYLGRATAELRAKTNQQQGMTDVA